MARNYQTVPSKVIGDAFTQAMWASYIQQNLNLGVAQLLADPVAVGANVASIDFAAIPQTFGSLLVVYTAMSDQGAGTFFTVNMRVNAISSGSYNSQVSYSSGATNTAAEQLSQTSALVGYIGASGGAPMQGRILIPNYWTGNVKSWICESYCAYGTATGQQRQLRGGGMNVGGAAITEVTLLAGTGNFVGGTVVSLYGLPT